MAVDYCALGEAFGAGGADVVLAELFEHAGADHAGEDGGHGASHSDGGENDVGEAAGAGDWEPSQLDGEQNNEDGAEGDVGKREAEEADYRDEAIVPSVAMLRGVDSGGDGERDGDEQSGEGEFKGERVTLNEKFGDGLVVADGASEVAVEDAALVVEVLFRERSVEAVGVAGGGDIGGGGAFAEHLGDGVSGDQVDQEED